MMMSAHALRTDVAGDIFESWRTANGWKAKLAADAERARRNQTRAQLRITKEVMERAIDDGALAVALTGSTARNRRTAISDLDYHVVGKRPDVSDLPAEVDVYASSPERLWSKLRTGDDFIQWTLRCGCILFDTGIMREALGYLVTENLWPDAESKLSRLPELVRVADRLIRIGDRDAAQDQVRATLTAAARGLLLREHVFPLSRSELPDQLRSTGRLEIALRLERSIHAELTMDELKDALEWGTSRRFLCRRLPPIGECPRRIPLLDVGPVQCRDHDGTGLPKERHLNCSLDHVPCASAGSVCG